MNGAYIKKSLVNGGSAPVRIDVGKYYSYDSDKKAYVLNMKDGRYVRYPGNGWEKEGYVSENTFYDYTLLKRPIWRSTHPCFATSTIQKLVRS